MKKVGTAYMSVRSTFIDDDDEDDGDEEDDDDEEDIEDDELTSDVKLRHAK